MSFHLSRTPILLDVVIMGEHFRAISHNGKEVSLLVNHLIHGLLCQVGSQSMDRLLDKLTIFLGFVKLNWFMLDKPLCFQ
jgi:hypothetical protein